MRKISKELAELIVAAKVHDVNFLSGYIDGALDVILPTKSHIDQVACDESQQDWSDLMFKKIYHEAFNDGAEYFRSRL